MICQCSVRYGEFGFVSKTISTRFAPMIVHLLVLCERYALLNNTLFTFEPLLDVRALGKFSYDYARYCGKTTLLSLCKKIRLECDVVFDVSNEELSCRKTYEKC